MWMIRIVSTCPMPHLCGALGVLVPVEDIASERIVVPTDTAATDGACRLVDNGNTNGDASDGEDSKPAQPAEPVAVGACCP
jgi:hypothetical protein